MQLDHVPLKSDMSQKRLEPYHVQLSDCVVSSRLKKAMKFLKLYGLVLIESSLAGQPRPILDRQDRHSYGRTTSVSPLTAIAV